MSAHPAHPALPADHVAEAVRSLLDELAASLVQSRKALLVIDLSAIEQENREQLRLARALSALLLPGSSADQSLFCTLGEAEKIPELQAVARRILHLVRVHSALLERARRSMRIRANRLLNFAPTYGTLVSAAGSAGIFSSAGTR